MEKIQITQNNGNHAYSVEEILKNSRFLSFYYGHNSSEIKKDSRVSISASHDFIGRDECELYIEGRKISFLLNANLVDDLIYFQQAYLRQLPQFNIPETTYKIQKISLMDLVSDRFSISFSLENIASHQNPVKYWDNFILRQEQDKPDFVKLWENINSFYRGLKSSKITDQESATIYLQALQESIRDLGTTHLAYDQTVNRIAQLIIDPELIEIVDVQLKGKKVTVKTYDDLKKSALFDWDVHFKLMNADPLRDRLDIETDSQTLFVVEMG